MSDPARPHADDSAKAGPVKLGFRHLALFAGPPILALVSTALVGNLLYDAKLWTPGVAIVGVIGGGLTLVGVRAPKIGWSVAADMYLWWVGFMIGLNMVRTLPWGSAETVVATVAVAAGLLGYLRLRAQGGTFVR